MSIIDGTLLIDFEFNGDSTYGRIDVGKMEDIKNLHEYFIAPAAQYNKESGEWNVIGYSLVHVTHLPTAEQLKDKMKGFTK